ncbi:helix-turn-helix domain-containing protein [Rhizobium sp. WW22]|uniref:helix-turn-helix domain-containing protein n=1 Tax=Rhizobium sp. WW22 TaxID=3389070 RepID=UPI000DD92E76
MSIGQELKAARVAKNLGQKDVAEALGVSVQAVSQWERNKTVPGAVNLVRLSQMLDIALDDDKIALVDLARYPDPGMSVPIISDFPSIFYGKQYAQNEGSLTDDYLEWENPKGSERVIINWKPKGNVFAMRLGDNSMEPLFQRGDILIFDAGVEPKPGDFVLAQHYPSQTLFRKYRFKGVASMSLIIDLVPLNEDYPTQTIKTGDEKATTGEITACLREFRRILSPGTK